MMNSPLDEQTRSANDSAVKQYCSAMASMGLVLATLLVEAATLRRGQPLPVKYTPGEQKQCYANSGKLVLNNDELRYCEGYAMHPGSIPVHHAWCLTPQGEIVDTTWAEPENSSYLGLVYDWEAASGLWNATGVWDLWSEMPSKELLALPLRDLLDARWVPQTTPSAFLDLRVSDVAQEGKKKSRRLMRDLNEMSGSKV